MLFIDISLGLGSYLLLIERHLAPGSRAPWAQTLFDSLWARSAVCARQAFAYSFEDLALFFEELFFSQRRPKGYGLRQSTRFRQAISARRPTGFSRSGPFFKLRRRFGHRSYLRLFRTLFSHRPALDFDRASFEILAGPSFLAVDFAALGKVANAVCGKKR